MKKILIVGTEAMPFAATGGLGDVLGSLPAALKKECRNNMDIRLVMPLYGAISAQWRSQMTFVKEFNVTLAWRNLYCGVWTLEKDGVTYYFLDNEYYFKRTELYGSFDDGERFAYFCSAVMQMMPHIDYFPDILHAHDWQSALSVVYLKRKYSSAERYRDIKAVFTIHNIEYQGKYDFSILEDIFALSSQEKTIVAYNDCINLMKGAIVCADRITTVSPTYAKQIQSAEYAHGLEYILCENSYKLSGILNGIDYEYYNPWTDKDIYARFSAKTSEKKVKNKLSFQREHNLPERSDVPMYAIITRLVSHKGVDLIEEMAERLLNEEIQLVVLGKGESHYEKFFVSLQEKYPDKVLALITYDRALSKKIYAAADMFLMPSKSEPCGLAQMIASRYGAVPICRETGGLYDSIKGLYEKDGEIIGNGFTFANYSSAELFERSMAALNFYKAKDKWEKLVKTVMSVDFSWDAQAKIYKDMYYSL